MEYTESLAEIKKTATRIKTLLDKPPATGQHSAMAVGNAKNQLNRIQRELAMLESTLLQFASVSSGAKVGPSETKVK